MSETPPTAPPRPPFSLRDALATDIETIRILDVGAMIEGTPRYAALLEQGLASVTGVEPNPEERARLERSEEANATWLPYFLGDGAEATFHVTRYPGCSSLLEPDPQVIDLFQTIGASREGGNFHVERTERVQTRRLDEVPDCPPIDYLKLDTQGSELDILRNATAKLADVQVIEVEAEFVPLYRNQPLFGDLQVFLRDAGFVFHKFVDIAGRCFRPFLIGDNQFAAMSQALWADAVFVRDFTRLAESNDAALLKAATVLHEVYLSYDLVLLFLGELDRRAGAGDAGLAARYHQAMQARPPRQRLFMNLKESLR